MARNKEQIGITDLSALTQWVNTVTKGVYNVEFVDGAETAAISGTRMILPTPNTAMTLRDAIRLRGFALHETSHPLYQQDAFEVLSEFPMSEDSPLRATYNMMLDVHAETSRAEEYPGDRKALSEFGAVLSMDVAEKLHPHMHELKDGDEMSKIMAILRSTIDAESQWNRGLASGFKDMFNDMPKHVVDMAEDVNDKFDLPNRLTDPSETGRSLWELARNVYEYVWKKDPDEEKQEASGKGGKGDGEGEGEGEEGEGSGGPGEEGDGKKGSGDPADGDVDQGDRTDGGEGGGKSSKGKIRMREMVWSSHYDGEKGAPGGHGKEMDFTNYTAHDMYIPVPHNQFKVINYDKEKARRPNPYRELVKNHAVNAPGFVSELRRLIQVESQAHYSQGHKSGKLATGRLWRVGAPPIDEGRWNASVFKRKTETSDVLDTCVQLLVDGSGSMNGNKFQQAYAAADMLNDTLTRILKIPTEVLAFSSYGPTPTMGIIKGFETSIVTPNEMYARFADFTNEMHGNNDADAIAWAYQRIRVRKEKRKIVIVFSDGSPADGNGDPYTALKKVVSEIETAGIVDIYGIGIMSDSVTHFYSQNDVIKSAQEIQRALIAVLRKAIHK